SQEIGVRHSDARMVPRPSAQSAHGYPDARGNRRHRRVRFASNPCADSRSYGKAHQCRISPMGPADSFPLDEAVEGPSPATGRKGPGSARAAAGYQVIVLAIAILVFLATILSPPALMD